MELEGRDPRAEAEALLVRIGAAGDGEIDLGEAALALARSIAWCCVTATGRIL
jgi:hypothetical protein